MSELELTPTPVTSTSPQIGSWVSELETMEVTYLADGVSSQPELRITWPNGKAVTVMYEETAAFYLEGVTKQ